VSGSTDEQSTHLAPAIESTAVQDPASGVAQDPSEHQHHRQTQDNDVTRRVELEHQAGQADTAGCDEHGLEQGLIFVRTVAERHEVVAVACGDDGTHREAAGGGPEHEPDHRRGVTVSDRLNQCTQEDEQEGKGEVGGDEQAAVDRKRVPPPDPRELRHPVVRR